MINSLFLSSLGSACWWTYFSSSSLIVVVDLLVIGIVSVQAFLFHLTARLFPSLSSYCCCCCGSHSSTLRQCSLLTLWRRNALSIEIPPAVPFSYRLVHVSGLSVLLGFEQSIPSHTSTLLFSHNWLISYVLGVCVCNCARMYNRMMLG